MGLRKRMLERGKKVVLGPQVMRMLSDDRVLKAAEGVLDARTRLRAAWRILLNGKGDELLYSRRAIDTSLPFPEIRARSDVTERAKAADPERFSAAIREGMPTRLPPPRDRGDDGSPDRGVDPPRSSLAPKGKPTAARVRIATASD